jgi:hypothetical protein
MGQAPFPMGGLHHQYVRVCVFHKDGQPKKELSPATTCSPGSVSPLWSNSQGWICGISNWQDQSAGSEPFHNPAIR